MEPLNDQGSCEAYAIRPFRSIEPLIISISFINAIKKVL